MPPHSMVEWILGQNFSSRPPRAPQPQLRAAFEWTTDDDTDTESVMLTVPQRPKAVQRPKQDVKKNVRFSDDTKPAQQEASPNEDQAKEQATESSAGETTDDSDAIHEQSNAKKAKEKQAAGKNKKGKGSQKKQKKKPPPKSETETETDTGTETETEVTEAETQTETETDAETQTDTEDEDLKSKATKKVKKQDHSQKKDKDKPKKKEKVERQPKKEEKVKKVVIEASKSDSKRSSKRSKKKKDESQQKPQPEPALLPPHHPPPDLRRPYVLMPPRSSVLQVEHTVESPDDPRPNAFYDNENGVMRVYHGPAYGNPNGVLYPKRVYNDQSLPVGTSHPMQNPWYNGFPEVAGRPVPPHVPPLAHQGPPVNAQPTASSHPWHQGDGTVTVPGGPGGAPGGAPEFTYDDKKYEEERNRQKFDLSPTAYPVEDGHRSHHRREERDRRHRHHHHRNRGNNDVLPSIEVSPPPPSWPAQSGSDAERRRRKNKGDEVFEKLSRDLDREAQHVQKTMERLSNKARSHDSWGNPINAGGSRKPSKSPTPAAGSGFGGASNSNNNNNHLNPDGFAANNGTWDSNAANDNTSGNAANDNIWGNTANDNTWANTANGSTARQTSPMPGAFPDSSGGGGLPIWGDPTAAQTTDYDFNKEGGDDMNKQDNVNNDQW